MTMKAKPLMTAVCIAALALGTVQAYGGKYNWATLDYPGVPWGATSGFDADRIVGGWRASPTLALLRGP